MEKGLKKYPEKQKMVLLDRVVAKFVFVSVGTFFVSLLVFHGIIAIFALIFALDPGLLLNNCVLSAHNALSSSPVSALANNPGFLKIRENLMLAAKGAIKSREEIVVTTCAVIVLVSILGCLLVAFIAFFLLNQRNFKNALNGELATVCQDYLANAKRNDLDIDDQKLYLSVVITGIEPSACDNSSTMSSGIGESRIKVALFKNISPAGEHYEQLSDIEKKSELQRLRSNAMSLGQSCSSNLDQVKDGSVDVLYSRDAFFSSERYYRDCLASKRVKYFVAGGVLAAVVFCGAVMITLSASIMPSNVSGIVDILYNESKAGKIKQSGIYFLIERFVGVDLGVNRSLSSMKTGFIAASSVITAIALIGLVILVCFYLRQNRSVLSFREIEKSFSKVKIEGGDVCCMGNDRRRFVIASNNPMEDRDVEFVDGKDFEEESKDHTPKIGLVFARNGYEVVTHDDLCNDCMTLKKGDCVVFVQEISIMPHDDKCVK